jgi:hypothetical protein
MFKTLKTTLIAGAIAALGLGSAQAEDIKLRIASGHPAANTYVNLKISTSSVSSTLFTPTGACHVKFREI